MQVDLYVSHDFAIQSLSGSDALRMMRADSESPTYSYSLGARFGFTMPSGMGIKTGFNISKVRNSFSYDETDGMGSTLPNTVTNTNSYTYVDIPLLFSYEMSGIGPFYYNINAGLLFNMTFTAEGSFLDPNGNVVSFTRGDENRFQAYEKTAGTALFASFGMHYVINDVFDFVLEPNIKYSLGPATLREYALDEKYTTVGLITGLRYKF